MNEPTVLVVDDDPTLLDMLAYNLRREGHRVLLAPDGANAVRLALAENPDLMILDLMLPGMSGFEVCRVVRRKLTTPILVLSAREDEADKIAALDAGADVYMTKPFRLRELLASIRALIRRSSMSAQGDSASSSAAGADGATWAGRESSGSRSTQVTIHDLLIDLAGRTVMRNGRVIHLKPKEFDLLAFLINHPGQVLTRDHLLDQIWGYDYAGSPRTVDVHISWLRTKLEPDVSTPQLIQTVYSVGYKFMPPVPGSWRGAPAVERAGLPGLTSR